MSKHLYEIVDRIRIATIQDELVVLFEFEEATYDAHVCIGVKDVTHEWQSLSDLIYNWAQGLKQLTSDISVSVRGPTQCVKKSVTYSHPVIVSGSGVGDIAAHIDQIILKARDRLNTFKYSRERQRSQVAGRAPLLN